MFGSQKYPEGQYKPERGAEHNWHVWCETGALEVLQSREYEKWLAEHPGESYTINFANGAFASIQSGNPLRQALTEIAKTFKVEVFLLAWTGPYVPWIGEADSLKTFDAISISSKT